MSTGRRMELVLADLLDHLHGHEGVQDVFNPVLRQGDVGVGPVSCAQTPLVVVGKVGVQHAVAYDDEHAGEPEVQVLEEERGHVHEQHRLHYEEAGVDEEERVQRRQNNVDRDEQEGEDILQCLWRCRRYSQHVVGEEPQHNDERVGEHDPHLHVLRRLFHPRLLEREPPAHNDDADYHSAGQEDRQPSPGGRFLQEDTCAKDREEELHGGLQRGHENLRLQAPVELLDDGALVVPFAEALLHLCGELVPPGAKAPQPPPGPVHRSSLLALAGLLATAE
mmetsp:Transcript_33631/g.104849  ORF Transcript_33631/g.104849 Transcript_33631/m.104849 type:complete len:279 (-) Transcript_33631:2076-2912(-)